MTRRGIRGSELPPEGTRVVGLRSQQLAQLSLLAQRRGTSESKELRRAVMVGLRLCCRAEDISVEQAVAESERLRAQAAASVST